MIKLTQKELEVLEAVGAFQPTEEKQYYTTSTSNKAIVALEAQKLIQTRKKGIHVEVALLDLGVAVLKSEVEHEIVASHEAEKFEPKQPEAVAEAESQFVLEDNVPIPNLRSRAKKPVPYPLDKMEIGQSFFVPVEDKNADLAKVRATFSTKITHAKKALGLTDRVFHTGIDPEQFGLRVWRRG